VHEVIAYKDVEGHSDEQNCGCLFGFLHRVEEVSVCFEEREQEEAWKLKDDVLGCKPAHLSILREEDQNLFRKC
jgi:hypothetical protein